MRALRLFVLIFVGWWQCSTAGLAAEYRLNNGDILRGEAVSFNDDGLVVRLAIGGHSPRVSWSKLTQETLQQLATNPQAARFVEPFIEVPPVPRDREKKDRQIVLKPVPRVEQVSKPNFFGALATPGGLVVFLVLYLANLYAAYEIARYRHRPVGLVCGLALIAPVIAPAIFLAMPPSAAADLGPEGVAEPGVAAMAAGKATTGPLAKASMASGLSISQGEKASAPSAAAPQVYKRGEFTFNRRFMETKFPGQFRVVQSEADKDMVLVVRTGKEEYIGKRISRISTNEMHVQLLRGNEVSIPFADITEVQLRHKDAKV